MNSIMHRCGLGLTIIGALACLSPARTESAPKPTPMAHQSAGASVPERGEGGGATQPIAGPDLSSWQPDGRAATVSLRDAKKVRVTPLRGEPLSNESEAFYVVFYVVYWCGVRLQTTGEAAAQSLVLVGTGQREVLSCDGIKAFGVVPAPRGVDRIAFIYEGRSPNTHGIRTVVIIESRSEPKAWAVNEDLSHAINLRGTVRSIPAVRAWLAKHPRAAR
ncbi:MAG: hypothetical protein LC098_06435 [Burkholderiales bacterium]|nr:hypothetical protein [Burkholderiales bacterium]